MANLLFRQEVLEFQRQQSLGEVVVVRPLSFRLLTAIAISIGIAVIGFAFWGEYTRKAHVQGYLAPSMGLIKVYPPEAGTLIEKHVTEGQPVKRGDTLFVLSTERSSRLTPEAQATAIDQLRQRRDSLKEELTKQRRIAQIEIENLRVRIRDTQAELAQIRVEMAIQEQRAASAKETARRYRDLSAKKFVPELEARQKQEELLDQQGRLQALQRSRLGLQGELNSVRLELASNELKAKNQQAAIEREISTKEQELTEYESRRNIVITAPGDGIVTTILATGGQNANAASPLLSILPAGAILEAQLLVPSRAIGFIAPDQTVALRYQPFPYQRFGSYRGRIKAISRTLITPKDADLPVNLEESVYRVTVALDAQRVKAYGEDMPLQAGTLLDADIWLDHRRIIEWIFDPLFSVIGRV
ncbi:MAG: HlyD family secretion protein [Gammaproteobacteria bacterium]